MTVNYSPKSSKSPDHRSGPQAASHWQCPDRRVRVAAGGRLELQVHGSIMAKFQKRLGKGCPATGSASGSAAEPRARQESRAAGRVTVTGTAAGATVSRRDRAGPGAGHGPGGTQWARLSPSLLRTEYYRRTTTTVTLRLVTLRVTVRTLGTR
jgi:hypothetical protein